MAAKYSLDAEQWRKDAAMASEARMDAELRVKALKDEIRVRARCTPAAAPSTPQIPSPASPVPPRPLPH